MKRTPAVGAAFLFAAIGATPAWAIDLICGPHIIQSAAGAIDYEVLKKCGEPAAKMGDAWIYEQGNMHRILTFNYEGRLLRIESRRN